MAHKAVVDRNPGMELAALEATHSILLDRGKPDFVVDSVADADPQALIEVLQSGTKVVATEFEPIVGRAVRHEVFADKVIESSRSAHQVGFGRFLGHKPNKANRVGNILATALKPFNGAAKAVQEFTGYGILKDAGIETFEPIGVFPSEDKTHYVVVTKRRDDLMSLDRDEWIVGRQPVNEREVEIATRNATTVAEIASVIALMHSKGIRAPDGQIKNFAITVDGEVGVIDTENVTKTEGQDATTVAEQAWEDIEKLAKSLILTQSDDIDEDKIFGVGMLANMNLPDIRSNLDELIFRPYLKALDDIMDAGGDHDMMIELGFLLYERFQNDKSWPQHLLVQHR